MSRRPTWAYRVTGTGGETARQGGRQRNVRILEVAGETPPDPRGLRQS